MKRVLLGYLSISLLTKAKINSVGKRVLVLREERALKASFKER